MTPNLAVKRRLLGFRLGLGCYTTDTLGLWALEMRCRDPTLIVGLCAGGNGRTIGTDDSNLVSRINLVGAGGRLLCALAAFATALCLGEKGGDPGIVDEVSSSSKHTKKNQVQEDATTDVSLRRQGRVRQGTYICGSKKLVGASTMLTVSLYTGTVNKALLLSLSTVMSCRRRSWG